MTPDVPVLSRGEGGFFRRLLSRRIAQRTALMSWVITLVTLTLFVLMTIPIQKKAYLDSLGSKTKGVAISMHETAAGAAVNNDFASVVSAAQTLLAGDQGLDFLIVIKNDGFALVIHQSGWKVAPEMDSYWLPRERLAAGTIHTVPVFNQRVFHYAQPFDYSGIQWGWIHVGHSLGGYDRNVNTLYRNLVFLSLLCLLLCFIISFLYASWLVRPVLVLRRVVQMLADGDFSIRAPARRRDELGGLARSVNAMADGLSRRDQILESIRFASQQFLRAPRWEEAVFPVLEHIGKSTAVGRVALYCRQKKDTQLCLAPGYVWTHPDAARHLPARDVSPLSDGRAEMADLAGFFDDNALFCGLASHLPRQLQGLVMDAKTVSLIAIPVFVEDRLWGVLVLEDLEEERAWGDVEKDSLGAGADILGSTIARQQFQEELLKAKSTLEERVEERTRELAIENAARQKALDELSTAQTTLVEMSRAAGMAEVATGVLHNVGNVLNSVNVSCNLIVNQIRESRVGNVARIAEMVSEAGDGLGPFFTEDPRGRQIPGYLVSLSSALKEEHNLIMAESESLNQRVEHIKEIVTMQQSYGRVSGVLETIGAEQLMEDALKLNAGALIRHNVTVRKEYQDVPPITVDKHQVLQILLNLINNAKYACDGVTEKKIITLRIFSPVQNRICMQVTDNGIGIAPENMTRIFQHGFTTRKKGHGFGLHSGAIAAKSFGGSLTVHSDGQGCGATFSLELPVFRGGEK